MAVYINDLAAFLPNQPVGNDQMEEVLGMVNQVPSRTRRIILRNNKIKTRYYAIDPQTGKTTHTCAQLAAEAIRRLKPHADFSLQEIACLSCGTSSPDQLLPGHGPMVHGELGNLPCETHSTAGICTSGMSALKFAWLNVALGLVDNAVATGSELSSSFMRAQLCGDLEQEKVEQLQKDLASGKVHSFTGPIYDQKGNILVAEGAVADDGMLAGMKVYVKGVEGDIPQ